MSRNNLEVESTLGLRISGNVFTPMLYKGDKYPVKTKDDKEIPLSNSVEFETNKDNQESLKIAIFTGEVVSTTDEGCSFVGEFDIPVSKKARGEAIYIVTFKQEKKNELQVTVKEKDGNEESV